MQNYYVKGLSFPTRPEPQETRSYNRIKRMPYTAYNNRSYNIVYNRDLKQDALNKVKRLVVILNNAIKNQAQTMFKYLNIYVQQKQQDEYRAQLVIIHQGLIKFQHALMIQHFKRLKQNTSINKYVLNTIFSKWLTFTLEKKCEKLQKQQKKNNIQFYQFILKKLFAKQQHNLIYGFNRLKQTRKKQLIAKLVNNIQLQLFRFQIKDTRAVSKIFKHPFEKVLGFYKIKQYHRYNIDKQYAFLIINNIVRKHVDKHLFYFINLLKVEPTKNLLPLKFMTRMIQGKIRMNLAYALKKLISLKVQDDEDQIISDSIKNISVISTQLSRKIKKKNYESIEVDKKLLFLKILNRQHQKIQARQKYYLTQWMYNITFSPQLYEDIQSRVTVLQNEKEIIMNDIELLEVLNSDLTQNFEQAKRTFLSEDSVQSTSNKDKEYRPIQLQPGPFELQDANQNEQQDQQEDNKIGFEYINFLKETHIELQYHYQIQEQEIKKEQANLLQELQQLQKQLDSME
ncbi:hypothetical protein pb186bvf_001742 [Paramecium bursaria]